MRNFTVSMATRSWTGVEYKQIVVRKNLSSIQNWEEDLGKKGIMRRSNWVWRGRLKKRLALERPQKGKERARRPFPLTKELGKKRPLGGRSRAGRSC